MNSSDIINNKNKVHAFLQPVISADKYEASAFEVLGRYEENDKYASMVSFFTDEYVEDEVKWEIDKWIYSWAVEKALRLEKLPVLHFNILPAVLGPLDAVEELLEFFEEIEKKGFPRSHTVFEIQAEKFEGTLKELTHILLYFKASGYLTAMDNIGINDTHLDQFSTLEPSIIKVDVSDLEETSSYYTYSEILDTLAFYARKLGAALHFTGIETSHQLHMAWRYGGRFFQGFLLGLPHAEGSSRSEKQEVVKDLIHSFIDMHYRWLDRQTELLVKMDERVKKVWTGRESLDTFLKSLTKKMDIEASRMYICDKYGYQQTVNWTKTEEAGWKMDETAKGKNWSWRVYFLDNVVEMQFNKNGMLSDKYRDIETNEIIRTYSCPLEKNLYLFVDLDPVYLYRQNWFQ
ncbi:EAL domain-containing protein [Alkalicoccus saliphilus]|uniref:EAL domain-containing protein n=1 Tax=Alkalicoccus saliphilus TaxID=200989 RepID=A0A2T4U7V7_9BACI|nr:EAL-associated domain-containing protein [Alkalicoccus saliphilus]PTL39493.1 hypothetical protein C6Y45_05470 [Alkalicoccus saliphilus]